MTGGCFLSLCGFLDYFFKSYFASGLQRILKMYLSLHFRYCRLHLLSWTCLLLSIYIILLLVLLLPQVTAVATTTQTKIIETENNQIEYRDQINTFRANYTIRKVMYNKRKAFITVV